MTEDIASDTTPAVEAAPAEAAAPASTKRWYVVHAYSGMEKTVERNLRERIDRSEIGHKFGRILVPMEEVVEVRRGAKVNAERKFFPGYVLIHMDLTDEAWHLVKNTPKVTGFLGGNNAGTLTSGGPVGQFFQEEGVAVGELLVEEAGYKLLDKKRMALAFDESHAFTAGFFSVLTVGIRMGVEKPQPHQ